jgi:hypothetical protein
VSGAEAAGDLPDVCPSCGAAAEWQHAEVDVALPLASDPAGAIAGARSTLIASAPYCGICCHVLLIFREFG